MRKISTKLIALDDKNKKTEPKNNDNQYYLPHPQIRLIKTPVKDASLQHQKDKNLIKLARKTSQYAPIRTFSIANLKSDFQNVSKEQDTTPQSKNNLGKKVELRKFRSTSERETPKRSISKSGFKLQLNSAKKEGPSKRINLKIQTPVAKKNEKGSLGSANFDSYYNNQVGMVESKTVRVQRRIEANSSDSATHNEFNELYGRCKKIIQDYQEKLDHVKSENKVLRQQNQKLRSLRDAVKKDLLQS